jgi:hypothetical protein
VPTTSLRSPFSDLKGASLSDQKTEALKNFKAPESKSELHSFLALASYASKWIPKYADLATELWELTRDDAVWSWDEGKQAKMDVIKNGMIERIKHKLEN